MSKKHYYITTPIYYVNGAPHIGHAYTSIACDVMARYKRLAGEEVFFLTGTDEHGQKVAKTAKDKGMSPQAFVDEVAADFRALTGELNLSNDDFIRTTEPRHKKAVQALWKRIQEKTPDAIYAGNYGGWYAVRDEAFYGEDELVTDASGKKVAPTGAPVEWVEEPSYFFRLSAFQERLLEYYAADEGVIFPKSRKNEVVSFVKSGLRDLSISRTSFDWGIPVPGDEKHVMYVWLDALANYITAVGFPDVNGAQFKAWWPADLHMVGKDILRFHAVYWPAFLMAADLPLPKRVVAHGWWTNAGEKISKSLGNVIDPRDLIKQYGLDQVRYYLMREVPFGNDGNFTHESMVNRINSELANNIGNLAQRTLSMIYKNCDGKIPEYIPSSEAGRISKDTVDYAVMSMGTGLNEILEEYMEKQEFSMALEFIMQKATEANQYFAKTAPWELKNSDPQRMASILRATAEAIRQLAIALAPFTPASSDRILDQLGVPEKERTLAWLEKHEALKAGASIAQPTPAFPKYEEKKAA